MKESNYQDKIKKVGKTNPLEDKNAGFLVHYCKNILNQKSKQKKNKYKIKKINKKEIINFLSSRK